MKDNKKISKFFVGKRIFRKDPASRPSCSELLREPYIASHIKSMIKRLEASKLEDLDSTLVIKKDRSEIANALQDFFIIFETRFYVNI